AMPDSSEGLKLGELEKWRSQGETTKRVQLVFLGNRAQVLEFSQSQKPQPTTSGKMRRVCSRKKLIMSRAVSRRSASSATRAASPRVTDRIIFLISGMLCGVTLSCLSPMPSKSIV